MGIVPRAENKNPPPVKPHFLSEGGANNRMIQSMRILLQFRIAGVEGVSHED
jgi:hypothetical protein